MPPNDRLSRHFLTLKRRVDDLQQAISDDEIPNIYLFSGNDIQVTDKVTLDVGPAVSGVYAISGGDGTGAIASVESWDGSTWTSEPAIPTARRDFGATSANGTLYAVGGLDGSGTRISAVDVYDGSSWSGIPDMPTARDNLAAATNASGDVFALGGFDGSSRLATAEVYDGSSWASISNMPNAVGGLAAVGDSAGNIYALGGFTNSFNNLSDVEIWDGSSWSAGPDMPSAHAGHAATIDDGDNIYVIAPNRSFYKYDGSSWSTLPDAPESRDNYAVAHSGGDIYYIGGDDGGGPTDRVDVWDGSSWAQISAMSTVRRRHGAGISL